MQYRVVWTGVLACWLLVATAGQRHLADRPFLIALGATMVATLYVALRGRSWLDALRLGRLVEREMHERAVMDADTVELNLYNLKSHRRDHDRLAHHGNK